MLLPLTRESLTRESLFRDSGQFRGWAAVWGSAGSGGLGCDRDLEAELFDLVGESSGVCLRIAAAGEVVGAELGIGLLLGQDMPDDADQGVGDGEDGLASPRLPKRRRKRWYCAPR